MKQTDSPRLAMLNDMNVYLIHKISSLNTGLFAFDYSWWVFNLFNNKILTFCNECVDQDFKPATWVKFFWFYIIISIIFRWIEHINQTILSNIWLDPAFFIQKH